MLKAGQAGCEIFKKKQSVASPVSIYLHDGLGCAASWRALPRQLARAAGHRAVVYSRAGHGGSPARAQARTPRFLHDEALGPLSAVSRAHQARHPILIGHSDGASIALLRAGLVGDVRGVVAIAPHLFVEDRTVESIARLRDEWLAGGVPRGLARYHGDGAAALVDDWTRVWLSREFAAWNIEAEVAQIRCPVLLVQGDDDAFGTMAQVDRACAALGDRVSTVIVPGADHVPHHTHADLTVPAIEDFLRSLAPTGSDSTAPRLS